MTYRTKAERRLARLAPLGTDYRRRQRRGRIQETIAAAIGLAGLIAMFLIPFWIATQGGIRHLIP